MDENLHHNTMLHMYMTATNTCIFPSIVAITNRRSSQVTFGDPFHNPLSSQSNMVMQRIPSPLRLWSLGNHTEIVGCTG